MPEQLTLYSNKYSPFAQRADLALREAGGKPGEGFTRFEVDLRNKPEWFTKVNPVGKVPAITYGGPIVLPEEPSEKSFKLSESLVIIEFIADIYPNSPFTPPNPVERAKARFFINTATTKFEPAWSHIVNRGNTDDAAKQALLDALETIQKLLPDDKSFALSDNFTTADAAFAPYLCRMYVALQKDLGAYKVGEGKKLFAEIDTPRFAKIRKYHDRVQARESVQASFSEELYIGILNHFYAEKRSQ